ncbi:hypothetical protein ACFE04_020850 [Oxalis oulophora]
MIGVAGRGWAVEESGWAEDITTSCVFVGGAVDDGLTVTGGQRTTAAHSWEAVGTILAHLIPTGAIIVGSIFQCLLGFSGLMSPSFEAGTCVEISIPQKLFLILFTLDSLGDTIRVSLTEAPEEEIDPCRRLANLDTRAAQLQKGVGWAVRVGEPILRGTFVCELIGRF